MNYRARLEGRGAQPGAEGTGVLVALDGPVCCSTAASDSCQLEIETGRWPSGAIGRAQQPAETTEGDSQKQLG